MTLTLLAAVPPHSTRSGTSAHLPSPVMPSPRALRKSCDTLATADASSMLTARGGSTDTVWLPLKTMLVTRWRCSVGP